MVRTRIAPSPTGVSVHLGNVRTALFNYLFAKKNNGKFIFRLEDTDIERNVKEAPQNILNDLRWLGITPDEGYGIGGEYGPYSQLERLNLYKQYADKLVEEGKAYRCYCSEDELNALREQAKEKKTYFKYPGTCRDRKDHPAGKDYVIRFKAPTDGCVEYEDLVFGHIKVPNKENQDFVILRSNGVPLYNFGCVVDDMTMEISHILRGRDHMINTPPQILMYQALGAKVPQIASLPMILGKDGSKLSKRHGSVSVIEYRDKGYTPGAVLNYIARFGWSSGDKEIFSLEELINDFDLAHCGKSDGKFDFDKFAAVQFAHMKSNTLVPNDVYTNHLGRFLETRGVSVEKEYLTSLIDVVRDKCRTFSEASEYLEPLLKSNISVDQELANKVLTENTKNNLKKIIPALKVIENWNEESIKSVISSSLQANNMQLKDVAQPLRVALSGRTVGPELFKMLNVVGREKSISRLEAV